MAKSAIMLLQETRATSLGLRQPLRAAFAAHWTPAPCGSEHLGWGDGADCARALCKLRLAVVKLVSTRVMEVRVQDGGAEIAVLRPQLSSGKPGRAADHDGAPRLGEGACAGAVAVMGRVNFSATDAGAVGVPRRRPDRA